MNLPNNSYLDRDGVIRWHSNDWVVPQDILQDHNIPRQTMIRCDFMRDRELRNFLEEYRQAMAHRTPEQVAEERAEARAAHGPGVELVNVLTGEKYTT